MAINGYPIGNRVLPDGQIVSVPNRGTLMGNRGCLHNANGELVKQWRSKAWIICVLERFDRKVPLRAPGRYTPLFFKDEVSALAAGHRPCAQCRPEAWRAFKACAELARALKSAGEIDAVLHNERRLTRSHPVFLTRTKFLELPIGVIGLQGATFYQITHEGPREWLWSGLVGAACQPGAEAFELVTPTLTIEILRQGYKV